MIEKKLVKERIVELKVKEWLEKELEGAGYARCEIERTPLAERIIIHTSKPGLIIGKGGDSIERLTEKLKKEFGFQNPAIEVRKVEIPELEPQIMAELIGKHIASFGVQRFKAVGHKNLQRMMQAGAIGAEIKIAGKVPGRRAKYWKFRAGYLPKCGHLAYTQVRTGFYIAKLKPGVVGITVKILPPGAQLPDQFKPKHGDIEG